MSDTEDPEPVDAEFEPADDSSEDDRPQKRGGISVYIIIFLIAVIVGVAGGAWLFWQYGPQQSASVDLSPLEARLAALEDTEPPAAFDASDLESRLATLESAPVSDSVSVDLSAIEERLAALEAGGIEAGGDPTVPVRVIALEAGLTRLEEEIAALDEADDDSESGRSHEALAALEARIIALESGPLADSGSVDLTGIEARLEALETRADPDLFYPSLLEERLLALETAETPAPDLSAIEARMAALEASLSQGLTQQAASGSEGRELAARSLALVALVEAAGTSQSFEAERAALSRLWRNHPALTALANHARSGIPTKDNLAQSYPRDAIENAIGTNRVFFGLIEVRPSEGSETSPLAIVALATEQLDEGDLASAVQLTEQLDGEALAAAQAWLVQAQARLAVNGALAELRNALTEEAAAQGADPT
ncbi:hypothetical protein [Hyphobacterium sp.]|uniref:COG4223 family protein n=1 Tax=Hyphobacterium sp. TaxID=2004662 RepID=UPI003BAB408E